jgi:hypothetical protein
MPDNAILMALGHNPALPPAFPSARPGRLSSGARDAAWR